MKIRMELREKRKKNQKKKYIKLQKQKTEGKGLHFLDIKKIIEKAVEGKHD